MQKYKIFFNIYFLNIIYFQNIFSEINLNIFADSFLSSPDILTDRTFRRHEERCECTLSLVSSSHDIDK